MPRGEISLETTEEKFGIRTKISEIEQYYTAC